MEEQDQDCEDDPHEEEEVVPEPHPLVHSRDALKERVSCPDCGRLVPAHCRRFTHRCRKSEATATARAETRAEAETSPEEGSANQKRPGVAKPLKNKTVTKRAEN